MKRALTFCLLLAGCANAASVKTACLPLKPYAPAEQKELASEIGALAPNSALSGAMTDYAAMRDADRACLNTKP